MNIVLDGILYFHIKGIKPHFHRQDIQGDEIIWDFI